MNLTDRISEISQAAWNRRGAIAQVAMGLAKCYGAFELSRHFPILGSNPVSPDEAGKALLSTFAYLGLTGTGFGDIVMGSTRARFDHDFDYRKSILPEFARRYHASSFGTFEMYAVMLFRELNKTVSR